MLKVCGKIVYVKSEKTDKGRHFKRLQLLSNGGAGRASLYDVTDMANDDWAVGNEVEIPCSIDVYQGKRGIAFFLTHWGGAGSGSPNADAPPASTGPVSGADGARGKFGG